LPTASAELEPPFREIVSYPALSELGDLQREFDEALLEAATFEAR